MNLRSKIFVGLCFAFALAFPAIADITYTQGSGTTIFDFTCFTTKHCSAHVPINSAGTEIGTSSNPIQVGAPASSMADGWDATQGAKADSVCGSATGTCSLVALIKYLNNAVNSAIPAGSAIIGKVGIDQTTPGTTNAVSTTNWPTTVDTNSGNKSASTPRMVIATDQPNLTTALNVRPTDGTNPIVVDPCAAVTKINLTGSQTTGTQIIAGTSSKKTYICSIQLIAQAAEIVNIIAGTGSVCATGSSAVMGSTTAANGMSYAANGGFTMGSGVATVIAATAANADNVCITQSGSSRITYQLTYVQL